MVLLEEPLELKILETKSAGSWYSTLAGPVSIALIAPDDELDDEEDEEDELPPGDPPVIVICCANCVTADQAAKEAIRALASGGYAFSSKYIAGGIIGLTRGPMYNCHCAI